MAIRGNEKLFASVIHAAERRKHTQNDAAIGLGVLGNLVISDWVGLIGETGRGICPRTLARMPVPALATTHPRKDAPMPRLPLSSCTPVLVCAVFLLTGDTAKSQDVQWRHDYSTARREATETGRPLLLDFGTEACVWCRKLDATTFRDPKVIKLLNERFIAVKVDGNKEERVTSALNVTSFPTLVIATADGKVVGRHVGYADVAKMLALLQNVPAATPSPAPAPTTAVAVAPIMPTAVQTPIAKENPSDADRWQRAKEQIDADLALLHPKLVADLAR